MTTSAIYRLMPEWELRHLLPSRGHISLQQNGRQRALIKCLVTFFATELSAPLKAVDTAHSVNETKSPNLLLDTKMWTRKPVKQRILSRAFSRLNGCLPDPKDAFHILTTRLQHWCGQNWGHLVLVNRLVMRPFRLLSHVLPDFGKVRWPPKHVGLTTACFLWMPCTCKMVFNSQNNITLHGINNIKTVR
jgi:hypothetical protein